jgi:hypothetical protein
MHVAAARTFTQYVAMVVELNTKHLSRLRRTLRRTALADRAGRDHAAEERWEGEGGNSRNTGVRRRR